MKSITNGDEKIEFSDDFEIITELHDTLRGIQTGNLFSYPIDRGNLLFFCNELLLY